MQHTASKAYLDEWSALGGDDQLPRLADVMPILESNYPETYVVFEKTNGAIVYRAAGTRMVDSLGDLVGKPMTFIYPEKIKALEENLVSLCIDQSVGVNRLARYWMGHRHKDFEWLMLPVKDDSDQIVIAGICTPFVHYDERDNLAIESDTVERIVIQNYLTLGRQLDLGYLSKKALAFLDKMGALLAVDGEEVHLESDDLIGAPAMAAMKAARPNVLAVANVMDLAATLKRLGARYNLKLVSTMGEALDIISSDKVDVLITDENVGGGTGLELLKIVHGISPFTGFVIMLEGREHGRSVEVMETETGTIHCLMKPVGEFAIRQAIDDTSLRMTKMAQESAIN